MTRRLACVFGGSGFIGRHIVRRLAAKGMRVRVGVRDSEAAHFLKPMGDVGQVVPLRVDITEPELVRAAIADAEIVINCVGLLNGSRTRFEHIHVEGAGNIAQAARAAGARSLVQISSLAASPVSPSIYARSKAEGEARVRAAFPNAVILRPSLVVGPEDSFLNRFAAMTTRSPFLPVIGTSRMQPVYVADVADAAIAALDPASHGKTYSLAGPRAYTMHEILELTLRTIGRRRTLLNVPMPIAAVVAIFGQLLPSPPLTLDQLRLLKLDNVAPDGAPGLAALGIEPTAIEAILPICLARFRDRYAQISLA